MGRSLKIAADDRRQGVTTALLDIALANAQNGMSVAFQVWGNPQLAWTFRKAMDRIHASSSVSTILQQSYSINFTGYGRVVFAGPFTDLRGYSFDLTICDEGDVGWIDFSDG